MDLEALEAAARAVGAAAADVDDDGAADDARNIDGSRFVGNDGNDAARFRLNAPALDLRAMRVDVRARALEDAAAVLMPASLALCAAAMREKRFPPSGEKGAFTDRDRCAGCDSRLALSFGFRACALCGEAACADCLRERRDALAAELARGDDQDPERKSGSPGTDAADYVFLCVATPTCLASATAAARRAGLRPAPTFSATRFSLDAHSENDFSKTSADYFTVSSLRAAGGFRSVAGVLVSPVGTRATSPVANVRLNTLANADDALSIAPACVKTGDAYARFRAEARWGADGTAAGDAAVPVLVFVLDSCVPKAFMERLERNATFARRKGESGAEKKTQSRKRRRTGKAEAGVGERDSNQENEDDGDDDDDDDDDDDSTPTFEDSFPSISAAASRLAVRAGAGELAADAADAGAAAREARLLFQTRDGDMGGRLAEDDSYDSSSLFCAMRDGRPLMATTTGVHDDDDDENKKRETNDATRAKRRPPTHASDASENEPGPGLASRRRFVFRGDSDETFSTGLNPMNPMNPPASSIVSALATTPFAALVHPLGALNVMAYSAKPSRDSFTAAKETKRVNPTEKETQKNGGLFFDAGVLSESELEAAPLVGFADARPATRALENVVLETCSHRDDVAVSLGVSALDACFFAAPPDEDEDVRNPEGNPEGDATRFWTVFKREDAPVLARWLALRGSALDEPCLAFEAQREARETAAALAAAARAARALADVDKSAVSDAAEAEAAAADAKQAAERAAFDAFDAVAGVSPSLAASALRRRDAFVLDDVDLEHLRRDVGVTPAWRNIEQHPGETFFVPAGCPRFAVANRAHSVARLFFLSAGSVSHALRMAHQSRFLPSGHPERGDAGNVRAAVANAAMQMEPRVREILRLTRSSEEGDETKTGDEKKKKRRFRRPSQSQG